MSSNPEGGSDFVNTLTALYLSSVDDNKRVSAIETLVDTAEDEKYSQGVKYKVAVALDFYAASNDLAASDYDEIDACYERNVETKFIIQDTVNIMPHSEKDAIFIFLSSAQDKKFPYLKEYFLKLAPELMAKTIPYYLGELLILIEEDIISDNQYFDLWMAMRESRNIQVIQNYLSEKHHLNNVDLMSDGLHNILRGDVTVRDNIATDWLIFMQEHSEEDEEDLMKRVFRLMSS